MKNKMLAVILAAQMILCLLTTALTPISADEAVGKPAQAVAKSAQSNDNTITIASAEDFAKFAKNCTLDTWSQGMTVNLICDIDFGKTAFTPVPTFGGRFNGNGHTVSGIAFSDDGSNMGLFRYVQEGAQITELNVKASITPGGTKNYVGGIAGKNSGDIRLCSFEGTVKGENIVGGIAGSNTESGQIIGCTSNGNITGENFVGGIVGRNSGSILNCTNNASVNTVYEQKTGVISDIDADTGAMIESFMITKEENEDESVLDHSDTGGIVGYTTGIVRGCINNGAVGYKHIGYNVGGIAGRQSGYLSECQNYGEIWGRKDIGGIVGQVEPCITLQIDESVLEEIRQGIDDLHTLVNDFINSADESGDSTQKHMDKISEYSKSAKDNTELMIERITDFTDDNLSEINAYAAILSDTLDKLIPVFESLENSGADLTDAIDGISSTLDETDIYAPDFDDEVNSIDSGVDEVRSAVKSIIDALDAIEINRPDLNDELDSIKNEIDSIYEAEENLNNASESVKQMLSALSSAVVLDDPTAVKSALNGFSDSIKKIIESKQAIKDALDEIKNIIERNPDSLESLGINAREVVEKLGIIVDNAAITASSLQTIAESIDTITLNTEIDVYQFQYAAQSMINAIEELETASEIIAYGLYDLGGAVRSLYDELDAFAADTQKEIETAKENLTYAGDELSEGFDNLESALEDTYNAADDYLDDMTNELNTAKDGLADALTSLSGAVGDIKTALSEVKDIISDLANEEPLEFVMLGDDFRTASSDLFDSLSDISDELDSMKITVTDGKEQISNDLTAISDQFSLIIDLVLDGFEEIQNGGEDSGIFLDVSDEDIENTKQGKVRGCHNYGKIEADRNGGGIAGAMSIEYSADPEDDIEKPDTFNFTYRTRAILDSCINEGAVTVKKDCAGGIVGLAELGTVYECENYGITESTSGNYVGGIAGKSEAPIRKCYSKSKLTGKRYIGGIAGKGNVITACCSIVSIDGDEYTGAVCGEAESTDNLTDNIFVDNGLGAVDGISYKGKAEPVGFDELKDSDGIPAKLISFTVTFIAEDKIIASEEIKYGDAAANIRYPAIPEKKGHFGYWQEPAFDTVTEDIEITCEYKPYITVISSDEKNESGKLSLALAEGEFTDKASLHIRESDKMPPADANGITKVYDISLFDTDIQADGTVTVRLLNESENKSKEKVTVWQLKDGKWEKLKASERGKYVIVEITGAESTVCLQYSKKASNPIIIISVIILLSVCVCVILRKKLKRKA